MSGQEGEDQEKTGALFGLTILQIMVTTLEYIH